MIKWIIIGVLVIFVLLSTYAMCKVASASDRAMEEWYEINHDNVVDDR